VNLIRGSGRRYNELAGRSLDRLAGISDGIFSVGMTLLVLALAVPTVSGGATEPDLWRELLRLGPNVLVYTMSFMTLGIFWVGQGSQLNQLARSNRNYSWLQLVFLFGVTLVPFSTALLARFPTYRVALVEYWLNIVLLGMALLAAFQYGLRAGLFKETEIPEVAPLIRGRILIAQSLYAIATATCLVFPTWAHWKRRLAATVYASALPLMSRRRPPGGGTRHIDAGRIRRRWLLMLSARCRWARSRLPWGSARRT
jgi:uncharacterized membrane protein